MDQYKITVLISCGENTVLMLAEYSKLFFPQPWGLCLSKCHKTYIQHSNFVITKSASEMLRTKKEKKNNQRFFKEK